MQLKLAGEKMAMPSGKSMRSSTLNLVETDVNENSVVKHSEGPRRMEMKGGIEGVGGWNHGELR